MRSFSFVISFALATACSSALSEPRDVELGQTVELRVGESAQVVNSPVSVRFAGVNESRCPTDVQCVQAGDAAIILTFNGSGGERADTLFLSKEPRAISYGAYRFSAISVLPFPLSTAPNARKTLTLRVADASLR